MVNIQNKDVMAEPGSSLSPSSPIYISCVILGDWLSLSELQFPHLQNEE